MLEEEGRKEVSQGIGPAAEKALEFLEKIVAAPIMEGTGILTDKVKMWRFRNQVNILVKANELLKSKGITTPKKLPARDIMSLLEHSSFEDDELMKDSWAKLLANAMNPENKFDTCHVFSQLLKQVSVDELKVLIFMFKQSFIISSSDRRYFDRNELIRESGLDYRTSELLVDNMLRLRVIEERPPRFKSGSSAAVVYQSVEEIEPNQIVPSNEYRLSIFGTEFIRQVRS